MKLSPIWRFLSSSFSTSKPGGMITCTTYLPGGSMGVPTLYASVVSGFPTQIVQLVPAMLDVTPFVDPNVVSGFPVVGLTPRELGNEYMPSIGAGWIWFQMCIAS